MSDPVRKFLATDAPQVSFTSGEALTTDYVIDAVLKSAQSEKWETVKRG